ncbi:RNA polymerase sigma factor [Stieleria varia]|uniref:RNA polymerase sigma factor n=1 Tax=Stieleria varia TaxID=2528005 RepID=UPI001E44CD7F|nr:sigma-70 family RNA polymerase sigma factor [Stieleria varia]
MIRRVQDRDSEAWIRFTRLYGPLVYSWARRRNLQGEDAGDLVQEVFLAVASGIDRFEPKKGSGFRGWLWGIARHKITDLARAKTRGPIARGGSTANQFIHAAPEESLDEPRDALAALARRAAQLVKTDFQPTTWQAFWNVCVEGHQPNRVAEDLGISIASVYTAKSRVLARLRSELEGAIDW